MCWKKQKTREAHVPEPMRYHEGLYLLQGGGAPLTRREYILYRPWGDGDPAFPSISLEIIKRLLAPMHILTRLHYWEKERSVIRSAKKGGMDGPEPLSLRYYGSLKNAGRAGEAHLDAKDLLVLSQGAEITLFERFTDRSSPEIWKSDLHMYGFYRRLIAPHQLSTVDITWVEGACDLVIDYMEQHDELRIAFPHGEVQTAPFFHLLQESCTAHGKELRVELSP